MPRNADRASQKDRVLTWPNQKLGANKALIRQKDAVSSCYTYLHNGSGEKDRGMSGIQ